MADNLVKAKYQKSECEVGVVHVGVGAFHRAHQCLYFDKLLVTSNDKNWGIAGVNLLNQSQGLIKQLQQRNNNYVLKEIDPEGETTYREINSILELHDHVSDPTSAQELLARKSVQLVTMTVTEAGYYLTQNRELNTEQFSQDEIEGRKGSTIYYFLRAGLNLRKDKLNEKITLLCCDNLRENGELLKTGFIQYLKLCNDQDLLAWVNNNVSFPSCMVDRITPVPLPEHASDVANKFNIENDATVMAEDFIQWVIEDNFAGAKPPLAAVGVEVIDNVIPYEEAKIRILNASHISISCQAVLKGIKYFDQAITEPKLSDFYDRFIYEETIPALGDNSPVDLVNYAKLIKHRFSNKNLQDTVARIALNAAEKIKIFLLPTIKYYIAQDVIPQHAMQAVASWYKFMCKVKNREIDFVYEEVQWEYLQQYLVPEKITDFANSRILWDDLPQKHPKFVASLTESIAKNM